MYYLLTAGMPIPVFHVPTPVAIDMNDAELMRQLGPDNQLIYAPFCNYYLQFSDVCQGELGDCYFLATLISILHHSHGRAYLTKMVTAHPIR